MGMKRQIERLRKWACNKVELDCWNCKYSVSDEWDCCPFARVLEAAEDRAKEGETMRKITCWYRVVNNERQWNHFEYGWTDRTSPLAIYKRQRKMWGNVKWDKTYGYLIDGVVKESEG